MPNEDNSTNSPILTDWSSLLSSVGYGFWIPRVWTASVTHNDTICLLNLTHRPSQAPSAPLRSRYQRQQVFLQLLALLQCQSAQMNPHLLVSV